MLAKIKSAGVMVESAFLRWSCGIVEDMLTALEVEVGLELKAVAKLAPLNKMQVAQSAVPLSLSIGTS